MSLFGVNMPPLYGEGLRNAFLRLQLEILGMSDDESILAWCWEGSTSFQSTQFLRGMLAGTPAPFKSSGDVHQTLFDENRPHYSMTNKGLAIELALLPALPAEANTTCELFFAPLNRSRQRDDKPIALLLQRRNGNHFARTVNLVPLEDFPYQGTTTAERKRVYIANAGDFEFRDHTASIQDGPAAKRHRLVDSSGEEGQTQQNVPLSPPLRFSRRSIVVPFTLSSSDVPPNQINSAPPFRNGNTALPPDNARITHILRCAGGSVSSPTRSH